MDLDRDLDEAAPAPAAAAAAPLVATLAHVSQDLPDDAARPPEQHTLRIPLDATFTVAWKVSNGGSVPLPAAARTGISKVVSVERLTQTRADSSPAGQSAVRLASTVLHELATTAASWSAYPLTSYAEASNRPLASSIDPLN